MSLLRWGIAVSSNLRERHCLQIILVTEAVSFLSLNQSSRPAGFPGPSCPVEEGKALTEEIEYFHRVLSDKTLLDDIIKTEMTEIKNKFATPRVSEIINGSFEDIDDESCLGYAADSVREFLFGRKYGNECSFRKCTVSDLTPSGSSRRLCLANGV